MFPQKMQAFNKERLTYSVHDGCVFKGHRVVIPSNLRRQILSKLHEGHLGIARMRSVARDIYWWPNIDRDIANFASCCTLCAKARNVPRNGYLQNWAETTYAFERVHMDICYIDGVSYLVIIDSFSKFVNVVRTRSHSSADVIAALQSTFKFCVCQLV